MIATRKKHRRSLLGGILRGTKGKKYLGEISYILISSKKPCQSGFTLIESLVAMVVVTSLLVGIAPLLAITALTRVQARRIDLASQAASSYINGVRGGVITIPDRPSTVTDTTVARDLKDVAPPTTWTTDMGTRVDTNGNGFSVDDPADLVIQPIRNGLSATTDVQRKVAITQGFDLYVRVYRADCFDASGNATGNLVKEQNSLIFSGTIDNLNTTDATLRSRSKCAPLAVATSDATGSKTVIKDYGNRIKGN